MTGHAMTIKTARDKLWSNIQHMKSMRAGRNNMALALRPWLNDTGATWHSTNDPRVFKHMRQPEMTYEIEYGNKIKERAHATYNNI